MSEHVTSKVERRIVRLLIEGVITVRKQANTADRDRRENAKSNRTDATRRDLG